MTMYKKLHIHLTKTDYCDKTDMSLYPEPYRGSLYHIENAAWHSGLLKLIERIGL